MRLPWAFLEMGRLPCSLHSTARFLFSLKRLGSSSLRDDRVQICQGHDSTSDAQALKALHFEDENFIAVSLSH